MQDYFIIHQRARIHGSVRILAYTSELASPWNTWSSWLKLFLYKYMPCTSWMLDSNFKETISTLSWELNIAGRDDYTMEFEFRHEDSVVDLIEDNHTV